MNPQFSPRYNTILPSWAWLSVLLVACCSSVQAAVVVTELSRKIGIFELEYLYDASGALSIDDVASKEFDTKIPGQFALGYRNGVAWFRVTLTNRSQNDSFILSFTEVFWSVLDLYAPAPDGWIVYRNGLRTPLHERAVQYAVPAFPISLPPSQTRTYYIKGQTVSSHIGKFLLFTEEEFFRSNRITTMDVYNVYSGVLFFIMLLVGFLYFTVRERVYVFYILYVLSFIAWISVQSGLYLNFGILGWSDALHAIGALVVLFLILFSKQLLELASHAPAINRVFEVSAFVVFLCGIAIMAQVPHANLFFNVFSSMFFLLLLAVSIKALIYDYFAGARYYLVALLIYMPSMALMTLTYNGLIPNLDFTRYAFAFGSFIEILFFSFILVSKYGDEKYRRLQIQSKLEQERERYQEFLENEVKRRTSELDNANQTLLKQTKELEEAKSRLSIEATTDALSGLMNRRHFIRQSERMFREARESRHPLSVLMMDIDRFKGINDNFGHKVGDDVIRACANIIRESVRDKDVVARYGGEEFVIIMPGSGREEALKFAEKIRKHVEVFRLPFIDNKRISVTLSIGASEINFDTDADVEDVLQRADKALYQAKGRGRNHVVFAPESAAAN